MSRKLFSVDPNIEQALAPLLKRRGATIHDYIRGAIRNQMERDGVTMPKRKTTGRPFVKRTTPDEEPRHDEDLDQQLGSEGPDETTGELPGQGFFDNNPPARRTEGEPF